MTNSESIERRRYSLESELVEDLVSWLSSGNTPWGKVKVVTEFGYSRGRTDVIAATESGEIIAFEAKLTKWRDAAHQAYRNTCFAHRSYVVLPELTARIAGGHDLEFSRRGVGICSFGDSSITVHRQAKRVEPIQNWLSERALVLLRG